MGRRGVGGDGGEYEGISVSKKKIGSGPRKKFTSLLMRLPDFSLVIAAAASHKDLAHPQPLSLKLKHIKTNTKKKF